MICEKLACAYQILSYLKLDDHTYTHLSARSETGNSFYIYPFGMLFHEVTPENLIEVSFQGKVLKGTSVANQTGYTIHASIYKNRPDISYIFHIHSPEIVAVSACLDGLLPLSQWALHFYNRVSYSAYDSLALYACQGSKIAEDLGENYVMFLRNHGSLTCGRTVEEAMFYSYHLFQACKTQCLTLSMNLPLDMPTKDVCEKAAHDLLTFEENLGARDWDAWCRLACKPLLK
jgi:ribulose-5-phosphate 4-epimerase/fuculose-1-phosphate aldolase